MIDRHFSIVLFVMLSVQMGAVFYVLFSPPSSSDTYKTTHIDTSEFTEIIQQELLPHLRQLENQRKNVVVTPVTVDDLHSHDAIRNIIQEELALFFEQLQSESNSFLIASDNAACLQQGAAHSTPAITDEHYIEQAMIKGHKIIDDAISVGKWSDKDEFLLQKYMRGLPEIYQKEVLAKLFEAISREEIKTVLDPSGF